MAVPEKKDVPFNKGGRGVCMPGEGRGKGGSKVFRAIISPEGLGIVLSGIGVTLLTVVGRGQSLPAALPLIFLWRRLPCGNGLEGTIVRRA